jgi:hypothetical protein
MEKLNPNHSSENKSKWEIREIKNETPKMFDMSQTYEAGDFLDILQSLLNSLIAENDIGLSEVIFVLESWKEQVIDLRTTNKDPDVKHLISFRHDPDGVIRISISVYMDNLGDSPSLN